LTKIAKDTRLIVAPTVEVRLSGPRIFVAADGPFRQVKGPVLNILEVFRQAERFDRALDELSDRGHTALDFVTLSSTVMMLVEWGVLVPQLDTAAPKGDPVEGMWTMHIDMLDDRARTDAYIEAIANAVKPGDVVVDLGTGTGILAVAAARAGARRVYAIERGGIADVAARVFADNDVDDRVVLLRGLSSELDPPELADVLVTEIFGHDPFAERAIEYIHDATRRWVKPGGAIIPSQLRVYAAAAELSQELVDKRRFSAKSAERWTSSYDMNLSAVGNVRPRHAFHLEDVADDKVRVLSERTLLFTSAIAALPATVVGHGRAIVVDDGRLDAAVLTFELDVGGRTISTAPDHAARANSWEPMVWAQPEPQPLKTGQSVTFDYQYAISRAHLSVNAAD
jgi:precorrin-6B methylase 2